MGLLLLLILLFVVMYAFTIRPQQRRAREHQALVSAVQVGDEVMTTAGIFGTVTAIEDDVISIEISPGTVMRVARAAIGRRMNAEFDQYEAGETFDDIDDIDDDDLGGSVTDETTTNAGDANGAAPSASNPEPPLSPPPPTPPATPPPTTPGSGSGPGEPV